MGCDIHGYMETKHDYSDKPWWNKELEIPDDRDYDFFGILANVRNYANAKPISEPKGTPFDVSDEVKEEIQRWNSDGHSHSYVTLKEFDDYDWESESLDGRISTIRKSTGEELGKASYTYEQDLSKEELDKLDVELKHLNRKAKDLLSPKWKAYIELMRTYSSNPENVRIVFWFDN